MRTTPDKQSVFSHVFSGLEDKKGMSDEPGKGSSDNVQVAVRCRPLSSGEKEAGHSVVVSVDVEQGEVVLTPPTSAGSHRRGEQARTFVFDSVFGPESQQLDIYNETARPIVDSVLEGYNGTIFAYGQTGTGKTFTMQGEKEPPEKRGIIPNSFAHIFGHIASCQGETQFLVRVSYLELYNEEVSDLLSKAVRKRLEVHVRPDVGVTVRDLSCFVVKNADEMEKLMTIGDRNRHFAVTDMNEHSSRSHVVFSVTVERSDVGPDGEPHVRMGKLNLVDLAGSERQSKTGAEGERLKESMKINLSLMMLGNVISQLVDGKSKHIPYRNSKLTLLLQDSLGGNSKTVMIANIGPASYNWDETLNTLRYANRAKNIQNKARINEDPKEAMLREFQKEIEELKRQLEEGSGGEEGEGEEGQRGKRKKRRREDNAGISPRSAAKVRVQLERERAELLKKTGLAEGERDSTRRELERKEEELAKAQEQHAEMERKLKDLSSKVIVGGVNLLEKAETQQRLLEQSARELEKRKKKEAKLTRKLQRKEAERVDMEEKYATLQDEAAAKKTRLKEVWREVQRTREELSNQRADFEQERQAMEETVRELSREVRLHQLVIDAYVPDQYQQLIHSHSTWNDDTGEWHLRGVAYTGNNVQRPQPPPHDHQEPEWDTRMAYLSYHIGEVRVHSLSERS
ncbi:Kinesin-like protein KIF3A [Geodia barretti]|uniref:Kinesin-like protein n=1 Tax=Geodia barretti TaxID=519541 RepID=A0AA35T4Y8_GEOBA|nr:Kinesin-like protein KIF3A [Geodia barretti]